MATAYADTISGQPITVAINATAWAQPVAVGWLARCRELNRLLGDATHFLRIPGVENSEPTWYAGVGGTSLAAGIERMAIAHDVLRNSIVAFPLDTRIYVANVERGLVRDEWMLYPDALETHIQTWREEGRHFTLLSGGGQQQVEMPNAADVPVDIDTATMTFQHASVALLAAGLIRWRDCFAAMGLMVVAVGLSFALAWWRSVPTIAPLQQVAALASQPAAPVRHIASAELAKLASLATEHDPVLWHLHNATELTYDTASGTVQLHSSSAMPVSTQIGPLPITPAVPPLQPYTLHAFHARLVSHLESHAWTLHLGDPYPIGHDTDLEQHLSVSIGNAEEPFETSVTLALIDLSERLVRVPITLHHAACTVVEGRLATCELTFALRGLSA